MLPISPLVIGRIIAAKWSKGETLSVLGNGIGYSEFSGGLI